LKAGPREGDALLFYGGAFGHVALVSHVDQRAGTVDLVEENWSPAGQASLALYPGNVVAIRDSSLGSYTVAGWLHNARSR
jgi:surface antigen